MSKIKRSFGASLAVLALALAVVLAPAVEVRAAELNAMGEEITEESTEAALRSIFSAEYYAEKYPDLKAVYGDDEDGLFEHFLDYGIKEGRNMSPVVDIQGYRDANPDLVEHFGDDWKGLIEHFVNHGIYEAADGTRPSGGILFNPVVYLREHPEVAEKTGGDLLKIVEDYIEQGMPAGDWADPSVAEVFMEDVNVPDEVVTDVVTDEPEVDIPATVPPTENEPSSDDHEDDGNTGGGGEISTPPGPVCDHSTLFCGMTCEVCGFVMDHDFGPTGTDPYCHRCHADFVQVKGCDHEWYGGTCQKCGKADGYYSSHGDMHVGESCLDCGYQGTLLWPVDECPGHDYGDGDTCIKCGSQKPTEVVDENNDGDSGEIEDEGEGTPGSGGETDVDSGTEEEGGTDATTGEDADTGMDAA